MSYVMHVDVIFSKERGATETEWLNSRHTYSFGRYFNMDRLNFGTLRVFNDDIVKPGQGFGMHAHENMEIVTIVLSGVLEHRDDRGNSVLLRAGDIQRMTAGTGIKHSEVNGSKDEDVHFLQIWVHPEKRGLKPEYAQCHFPSSCFDEVFYPIISKAALCGVLEGQRPLDINQDVTFYLGNFKEKKEYIHTTRKKNRGVYLFIIEGAIEIGSQRLNKGDSAQITQTESVQMEIQPRSKILLIEVDINTL